MYSELRSDLLGRISGVCEISSSNLAGDTPTDCGMDIAGTGYVTSYTYDMANHKVTIDQGSRQRVFQTDSAGRTTMTVEPERGETDYSYSYNTTGLVVTRARAKANQYDSNVKTTTTTQYDKLSRVVSISYDDGVTPTKHFYYDGTTGGGWQSSPINALGLLSGTSTDSSGSPTASKMSYDLMGNVTSIQQCAPSLCSTSNRESRPPLTFSYDYAGNVLSASDGVSGTIAYTRSVAGEVTQITNNTFQDQYNPATLVSSVSNGPFGPSTYGLGNGTSQWNQYDSLGRDHYNLTCSPGIACGSNGFQQMYGTSTDWSGARAANFVCDTVINVCRTPSYDEFDRLTAITGTASSYTYTYDRYGNRLSQTPVNGTSGPSPSFSYNVHNQPSGLPYDATGNMMSDGLGNTYSYDAEGNVLTVNGGPSVTYDAQNRRVAATVGGTQYEYLYDQTGKRRSTWLASSNVGVEGRIYWDGRQIAYRAQNGQTYFEHQNLLGTERGRSNYQGQLIYSSKSLAFGDGNQTSSATASGDGQDNNQFTSQEQEADGTVHFQFRQYSPLQGRWMSPDPYDGSYDNANPQSLNRYSYVLNSPLSLTDPTGLEWTSDGYWCEGYKFWITGNDGIPYIGGGVSCTYYGLPSGGGYSGIGSSSGAASSSGGGSGGAPAPAPAPAPNRLTPANPCQFQNKAQSPQEYARLGATASAYGSAVFAVYSAAGFPRGSFLDAQPKAGIGSVLDQGYGGLERAAYGNYVYGDYMAAAGVPLSAALGLANLFAISSTYSIKNGPMSSAYTHLPEANVANITRGYTDQTNGTLCHR